jgi:LytR cell envelope-related transcriptional attenuator
VAVATSTIRFAIIVALVVVGAVVIAQFPRGATSATGTTPSPSASLTGGPGGGGGQGNANGGGTQAPTPTAEGVKVAVYNGTTQTGLAADVATRLERKFGVKVNPNTSILNAPSIPVAVTTVYFVSAADKDAATVLADALSKKLLTPAKAQKLPDNTTVPAGVQVAVYLGTDYVNG